LTAAPQKPSPPGDAPPAQGQNITAGTVAGTIKPVSVGNVFLPPGMYGGTSDTNKQSVIPIKEGWLKISSILLVVRNFFTLSWRKQYNNLFFIKNNRRYPNIPLGGGNFAKVNLIEGDIGVPTGASSNNPSQFGKNFFFLIFFHSFF
jgi:hypothetical protein